MKNIYFNKGFTLIELLVVVLIIGILAAIALPQYNKAVLKSKFSTVMPMAKALQTGNEAFFLSNGYYSDEMEDLVISAEGMEDTENLNITLSSQNRYKYVKVGRDDIHNNYIAYQAHSKNYPGEIHCEALTDDEMANWLCKDALQGTPVQGSVTPGYTTYVVEGSGNGTPRVKWDINGDGRVTIADVTALNNIVLGKDSSDYNVEEADINGDGVYTTADVTLLTNCGLLGKTDGCPQ